MLIIYLTTQLDYGNDDATVIYHSHMTISFLTAIFGAIVSDTWLGKFNTILLMFVLSLVGMLMLNLGAVPALNLAARELTIVALAVIGLGFGCMKPCMASIGGDQFRVPEQLHLMSNYFSLVFLMMKLSSFLGTALTPILRNNTKCFGQDSCYLLVFGVSGAILLASLRASRVVGFVGPVLTG